MKSVLKDGIICIKTLTKSVQISDKDCTILVHAGSLFTLDVTTIDWYNTEFIKQYKSFFVDLDEPIKTFPYLITSSKFSKYR